MGMNKKEGIGCGEDHVSFNNTNDGEDKTTTTTV